MQKPHHWTLRIAAIAICTGVTGCCESTRSNVAPTRAETPLCDLATTLNAPGHEHRKTRRNAAKAIREDYRAAVDELTRIVESPCQEDFFSPKGLAAGALADLNALEAVPALTRNLEFREQILIIELAEFHFDEYPCGDALRRLGRPALEPMLAEIARRTKPFDANGVNVAGYVIVAMCGDSKEEALKAIGVAEERHGASTTLHQVHMHIQHFMGIEKQIKRMHAEPKA